MKSAMSKRVAALVMIGSMMGPTVVQAAEIKKDESVYVNLDADGSLEKTIVSDWLHSDESGTTVYDKSELSNIKNVKSDIEPHKNGGDLIWDIDGSDIYYQGTIDKDIPFDVSIKYYYEDEEIDPKDLAGKSGKVKIEINIKNKEYKEVNINGKIRNVYTPFVVAGEVTLPNDKFLEVTTDGGTMLSEGNNNIVAFVKMPGLKDSLQLDSIPFAPDSEKIQKINDLTDGKIIVEADADEFTLGPIMITAATDVSMLNNLDGALDLNSYKDKLSAMKDNYDKIIAGDTELNNGIIKGYSAVQNGLSMINQPKYVEKLSLITNQDKVNRANRLLDDAYFAKDLDTAQAAKLLGIVQYGNNLIQSGRYKDIVTDSSRILAHSDVMLSKGKGLLNENALLISNGDKLISGYNFIAENKNELADGFGILKNKSMQVQSVLNNEEMMKELSLLIKDIQGLEDNYDKLDYKTKNILKVISASVTPENLKAINDTKAKLTPAQNALKNAINKSGGTERFAANLHNALVTLKALSKVDLSSIKTDVNNYGSAYLIIRSELMAAQMSGNLEKKKAELKESVKAVYGSNAELESKLECAIDGFSINLTQGGIINDCKKAANNSHTLESLGQGVQTLQALSAMLDEAENLTSQTEYITSVLNIVTGNDEVLSKLTGLVQEVSSLPQDQQADLLNMAGSLGILMSDIDANKTNIDALKGLIGTKGLSKEDIQKFNEFVDSLNKAESSVNELRSTALPVIDGKDFNNTINGLRSYTDEIDAYKHKYADGLNKLNDLDRLNNYLYSSQFRAEYEDGMNKIKDLMSRQNDLKNSQDILRILRESLEKNEVDKARNLINTLPSYKSQLDELKNGSRELSDGLKQYGDAAVNEIHNKGNNALSAIDELYKVKDELVKSSNDYGCFAGKDESMKGSTKFIMKTNEIEYKQDEDDDESQKSTEKKGFFAWLKSLFIKD